MQNDYSTILGARSTDLEFYTRVMMVVALCGVTFGLAFGLYHLFWGNQLLSLVLLPVVCLQIITVYLLKKNGFSRFAAWTIALLQTAATIFYSLEIGLVASYWLFASGVANYYIVDRKVALSFNAVACFVIAVYALGEPAIAIRYAASFVMINIFLFSFARQLEKKNAQLDHMLTVDPLTMAGNRTALEATLRRVKSQYDRHETPVSLIMIDLDHFKRINDTHGHSEGDRVLNRIAALIKKRLRPTDSLFRFGGEEFIVITENTHLNQAAYLAEDIRKRVESDVDDQRKHADDALTVSLGLAQLRGNEAADDWLGRADKAMYKAKAMGRNWICFDADTSADQTGNPSGTASTL
ncbi:MAG: GGDEF domain-containing protein [Pseudohongiella sp.]|nr:GGDEF domain-containing protein [Pseudohongiella sp.]